METENSVMHKSKQLNCTNCTPFNMKSMRLDVSVIQPEVVAAELIAEGMSAFSCPHCNAPISNKDAGNLKGFKDVFCECEKELGIYSVNLGLVPASAELLEKKAIKTVTWFHATDVEDWLPKIIKSEYRPYAHVGSKEAALELAAGRYFDEDVYEPPSFIYLWEVTINPEAVVADDLLQDENNWCEKASSCARKHLGGDVQPYLNKWEAPGTISLLLDPSCLSAVTVQKITSEDCAEFIWEREPELVAA